MAKYIDADLLRKEITDRLDLFKELSSDTISPIRIDECKKIIGIIDSLQQEQPDFPTTDEQVKEFLATHPKIKVPEKYKNPDWLFKKQEQPEVDLEQEAVQFCFDKGLNLTPYQAKTIARHFFERGQRRAAEMCDEIEYNRQRAEDEML